MSAGPRIEKRLGHVPGDAGDAFPMRSAVNDWGIRRRRWLCHSIVPMVHPPAASTNVRGVGLT